MKNEILPTLLGFTTTENQRIISEVSGFVDYYLADGGDGVMISVSVFEDQSGRRSPTGGLQTTCGRV